MTYMSEDYGANFITLTDEDGNEYELEHLDTIEFNGHVYMAFFPVVETEDGEEADAFLIDYYGNVMEAIWTEEGLDLNYFDSMLMHFVPEPEEVLGE